MKNAKKKTRTKHDKLNARIRELQAEEVRLEAQLEAKKQSVEVEMLRLEEDIEKLEQIKQQRIKDVFSLETRASTITVKINQMRNDVIALREVLNKVEID